MIRSPSHTHLPAVGDFAPETVRGWPGFFRVGRARTGRWWLIDPYNHAFFGKAVSGVRVSATDDPAQAFRAAVQRLRGWHFNTLGPDSRVPADGSGLYETRVLGFRRVGPVLHLGDLWLPDVFDPAWTKAADALAREVCSPLLARRDLIGYYTDDGLGWAQPDGPSRGRRPGLLQLCLSLEPNFRAYHAAWEFVLAPRRGDIGQLGREWGVNLAHPGSLRQLTVEDAVLDSPAYSKDQYQFTREFARRYHATAAAAIRAHDPHHLVLGARWHEHPGDAVLQEAGYPHTDCLSMSSNEPGRWATILSQCGRSGPVMLDRVQWRLSPDVHETPNPGSAAALERRLREGCASLQEVAAHPALVGYEWASWADDPLDPPLFGAGLLRGSGEPAREHVDLLSTLNAHMDQWRVGAPSLG